MSIDFDYGDFDWDDDVSEAIHQSILDFNANNLIRINGNHNTSNNAHNNKLKNKKNGTDIPFDFSKLEFGNFDDQELNIFRRVSNHNIPTNSFRLFWKENGDITIYFKCSPHSFWIEINKNIIKKVMAFDNTQSVAIELEHAPNVFRQLDRHDEPKTRMAAPIDGTTRSTVWLHSFNVAKTLLFSRPSSSIDADLFQKKMKGHYLYATRNCSLSSLSLAVIDGIDLEGNLSVDLGVPFETMYLLLTLNSKVPGLLASRDRLVELKHTIDDLNVDFKYRFVNNALEKCLQSDFYPSEFLPRLEKLAHKRQHMTYVKSDPNMFEIRKVMITPTGIKYMPKSLESGNRVLRKYKTYEDRFLRVTFCDEGLNKVSAEKVTNMHPRLEKFLNEGIEIGGRFYEMLAYSNSQLRSHSCWFLNTGHDLSVDSIINDLGDFSDIKVMAKYAARIGQCFSNTSNGIKANFIEVDDIVAYEIDKGVLKENVLNDGCSRASRKYIEYVSKQMKIRLHGKPYIPSALQFRLGGCKGVVVQDHDIDMLNVDLVLTKSQKKFKDDGNNEFELVAFSKRPKFSTLNRQIIILLSSNGLPDSAFMKFLDKELKTWKSRRTDKFCLRRLLRRVSGNIVGENIKKLIVSNNLDLKAQVLSSQIPEMPHHIDFFYNLDPLLCNLCDKIMISQFSNLKSNLPVDKCSLLMGVVDFYGVLEDDEVFIQLSAFEIYERDLYEPGSYAEGGIVSGDVFVTRNPCLHPGDIRKLKAVSGSKIEPLKHLKDVIVFSQKSICSQASKMSGGDYDGDLFMVCWDPDLQNFKEFPPMKHTPLKPIEKPEGFDYKATRDFLKEYVVNDNLGVVAFMHMEHYDQSSKGAHDVKCLELADYHSHQVDYAKTGLRKALPTELTSECRPHYMPKIFLKQTYHSEKILGKIHDKVEEFMKSNKKLEKKTSNFNFNPHFKTLDLLFVKYKPLQMLFKEHDQFKEVKNVSEDSLISNDILDAFKSIKELYKSFKSDLERLTSTYYVEETELVLGYVDCKKLETKIGKCHFKLREEIHTHVDKFIKYFFGEASKIVKSNILSKQEIASIFYIVVRNDNIERKKFKEMFGLTFYWLVMDNLIK